MFVTKATCLSATSHKTVVFVVLVGFFSGGEGIWYVSEEFQHAKVKVVGKGN